jgi:hypothetical protein
MTVATPSKSDIKQFDLEKIPNVGMSETILGYYVTSTAPINVEDMPPPQKEGDVATKIREVARFLVDSPAPELVISIHGYGTQRDDARKRYNRIYKYASEIYNDKTHVFFGYLWPSEKPTGTNDPDMPNERLSDKIRYAFQALPIFPSRIFWGGLGLAISTLLLLLPIFFLNWLLAPVLFLATLSFAILLALILLRLSTYFRDNYRATNYGVPDLVELLRQVDQAVYTTVFLDALEGAPLGEVIQRANITAEEWQAADRKTRFDYWDRIKDEKRKSELLNDAQDDLDERMPEAKKVKLSFIGHSMGCFVVTNTIRILSDVFDHRAIEGIPSRQIGRVFCLGRLVLVAPDIPVETIMPRRANFLRSSLLRCDESYVFCNEGDLALRLASTAANYFSFPAKTRSSGYRLGNITLRWFDHSQKIPGISDRDYGIVNWKDGVVKSPFECLEIRSSDQKHKALKDKRNRNEVINDQIGSTLSTEKAPVSDLFTYFDCTNYIDEKTEAGNGKNETPPIALVPITSGKKGEGIVTFANGKQDLSLIDYIALCFAYFFPHIPRDINTHGGYFDGIFSQQAIYQLAFGGFDKFLGLFASEAQENPSPSESKSEGLLRQLSQYCEHKGIRVLLSPIRYDRNIKGNPRIVQSDSSA